MSSNDNSSSTLKSFVDSATGAAQAAFGALTGNTADQKKGEANQQKAQAESDASHATLKGPGFTATADGVAKDNKDRNEGSWNQTVGAAKEAVGGLVGSKNIQEAGRQQNLEGQQQEAKGQLNDLSGGIADRVTGTLGGAAAGLTGNTGAQEAYKGQHDDGKTRQRGVEADLQKRAEAEAKQ